MHLPNIDALIKHSISCHWGENVSEAPEEPEVYAWFLPNLGSEFQSLGALFSSVQKRLDRTGALTEVVGRVGASHLAIRQAVGSEDWEARLAEQEWPLSRSQIESAANLLLALSIFSPPVCRRRI